MWSEVPGADIVTKFGYNPCARGKIPTEGSKLGFLHCLCIWF